MTGYVTKDSGAREVYATGMRRDTEAGKPRLDLAFPEGVAYDDQLLVRLGYLLARGAEKYGERNWESGFDEKALARAKSSALRHLVQWLTGEEDEDHAAAVIFNLMQAEYLEIMRPGVKPYDHGDLARSVKRSLAVLAETVGDHRLTTVDQLRILPVSMEVEVYDGQDWRTYTKLHDGSWCNDNESGSVDSELLLARGDGSVVIR